MLKYKKLKKQKDKETLASIFKEMAQPRSAFASSLLALPQLPGGDFLGCRESVIQVRCTKGR